MPTKRKQPEKESQGLRLKVTDTRKKRRLDDSDIHVSNPTRSHQPTVCPSTWAACRDDGPSGTSTPPAANTRASTKRKLAETESLKVKLTLRATKKPRNANASEPSRKRAIEEDTESAPLKLRLRGEEKRRVADYSTDAALPAARTKTARKRTRAEAEPAPSALEAKQAKRARIVGSSEDSSGIKLKFKLQPGFLSNQAQQSISVDDAVYLVLKHGEAKCNLGASF